MGKLGARIAALEKKRAPTDKLPFKPTPLQETERFIAEVIRQTEEEEKAEALITASERLASRRRSSQHWTRDRRALLNHGI